MDQARATSPAVRQVLRSFQKHKRLIDLVRAMASEMERLEEDNRQLRAAVGMYREVMRRHGATVIEIPQSEAARARASKPPVS